MIFLFNFFLKLIFGHSHYFRDPNNDCEIFVLSNLHQYNPLLLFSTYRLILATWLKTFFWQLFNSLKHLLNNTNMIDCSKSHSRRFTYLYELLLIYFLSFWPIIQLYFHPSFINKWPQYYFFLYFFIALSFFFSNSYLRIYFIFIRSTCNSLDGRDDFENRFLTPKTIYYYSIVACSTKINSNRIFL